MSKKDNFHDFLEDLYEGIEFKKPGASRNPQDFRSEIESIVSGGGASLAEFDGVCKVTGVPTEEDHGEFLNEYDGKCKVSGVPAEEDTGSEEGIVEVDELPTENIDVNAIYKMGESYYRYVDGEWKQYVIPVDTLNVTENGTYDVTDKKEVKVSIPQYKGKVVLS
jgi:hypothetical protein